MRRVRERTLIVAVCGCLALGGCVTGHRNIELSLPPVAGGGADHGPISIDEVLDARQFENDPRSPSTPSILGDVTRLTVEQKQMFIGRQRNTYGKGMGDIAVTKGTVPSLIRDLLAQGFQQRGYSVSSAPSIGPTVNVTVNEFWAWFSPGFATVSFEARIKATLNVTNSAKTSAIEVTGYGRNLGQIARDANWQLAYRRAFEDFLKNLDRKLAEAGL